MMIPVCICDTRLRFEVGNCPPMGVARGMRVGVPYIPGIFPFVIVAMYDIVPYHPLFVAVGW